MILEHLKEMLECQDFSWRTWLRLRLKDNDSKAQRILRLWLGRNCGSIARLKKSKARRVREAELLLRMVRETSSIQWFQGLDLAMTRLEAPKVANPMRSRASYLSKTRLIGTLWGKRSRVAARSHCRECSLRQVIVKDLWTRSKLKIQTLRFQCQMEAQQRQEVWGSLMRQSVETWESFINSACKFKWRVVVYSPKILDIWRSSTYLGSFYEMRNKDSLWELRS